MHGAAAPPYKLFGLVAVGMLLFSIGAISLFSNLSFVQNYLVSVSLTAFTLCGHDKRAAIANATRVPERIHYLLAILGGTPGLLIGMTTFGHKVRKAKFQFHVTLILLAQIMLCFMFAKM